MILQSKFDQFNAKKRLKVFLIILTTLAVSVALYVVIRIGREENTDTPPPPTSPPLQITEEEIKEQMSLPREKEAADTSVTETVIQKSMGEKNPNPPSKEEQDKTMEALKASMNQKN